MNSQEELDQLEVLLKEVVDIHADCIWSYDTDDHGGHPKNQCKAKLEALISKKCLEVRYKELEWVYDRLAPIANVPNPDKRIWNIWANIGEEMSELNNTRNLFQVKQTKGDR